MKFLSSSIFILTLFLLFFTSCNPGYSHIKKHYDVLNNQTVFVQTVETAGPHACTEAGLAEGEESEICGTLMANLPTVTGRYVGTGTFIKYQGSIHVLTAEHVCNPEEFANVLERGNITIHVKRTSEITINSQKFFSHATIIKKNAEHDLCLLRLEEQPAKIKVAKVEKTKTRRGAEVHYAGAPYGMMSEDFLLTFEGSYAGTIKEAMVFSLPCAQGASGSSIRNKKNKIISMVQRVHPEFNHVCFGVRTEHLISFLKQP